MVWSARVRSLVARHRAVYWGVVGALALTICIVLLTQSRRVVAARDAWGDTVEVWTARADAAPGDRIDAQRRRLPVAMVPTDAVLGRWPTDATARQHVSAGEVVVGHDVGQGRLPLLAEGRRAVAIASDDTTIPVEVGDRVDVTAAGLLLADDGLVVTIAPGAVVIAVQEGDAPAVAAAAADRTAVVVLRPG